MTRRVLLIGWDAADWRAIRPLMAEGKLPFLSAFIEQGVTGNLATLSPVLSPMLWTSIATGKRPFRHGILGFTEPRPDGTGVQPVTNLSRKAKAVWNILNQEGLRCNVVGWWPSHPAEPLNGVMVSNRFQIAVGPPGTPWPMRPGTIHPPELAEELAELRVNPNELTAAHILPFIPQAAEIDQKKDRRVASVLKILADCASIQGAATWLVENTPWDFMAVYFDGIDHFGHGFMKYHPPRRPGIKERDFELYKGVVEGGYRFHDMMLGRLLQLAGEETTVVLLSDHGFHPDHLRPDGIPREPAGPAIEHRELGILALRGPGLRAGEERYGASLLDIAPTVLTLFGLPVGEDMDGRPLIDAFECPPEVSTIPSWEDVPGESGQHPPDRQLDPVESNEAMRHLVALGYIEEPDANRERAVADTLDEQRFNLARSYLDGDRYGDALPLLEELYRRRPTEYRFGLQLAICYQGMGRLDPARTLVDDLLARRRKESERAARKLDELETQLPGKSWKEATPAEIEAVFNEQQRRAIAQLRQTATPRPATLEYLRGCLHLAEGQYPAALSRLRRAAEWTPGQPHILLKTGEALLELKRWGDAEQVFDRVLALDPESPDGHLGRARAHLGRRQNREAAEAAATAAGLRYHFPMAHYCLGVALHRLGELDRAVDALEAAVALNPNFKEAHKRLVHLHERRLNAPERAAAHRDWLEQIRVEGRRRRKLKSAPPPEVVEPEPVDIFPAQPPATPPTEATPAQAAAGVPEPGSDGLVIVVSGLPRSGTSMMMQMLQAGGVPVLTDGERGPDASNPRGYLEYEAARRLREDRTWLKEAVGGAVKIVAQLLPFLPMRYRYKVILMERELDQVLASQAKMIVGQGGDGAKLPPERLKGVFQQHLRGIHQMLAQRAVPTLSVQYEEALAQPGRVAAAVEEFLGLELKREAMTACVDPALCHHGEGAS